MTYLKRRKHNDLSDWYRVFYTYSLWRLLSWSKNDGRISTSLLPLKSLKENVKLT